MNWLSIALSGRCTTKFLPAEFFVPLYQFLIYTICDHLCYIHFAKKPWLSSAICDLYLPQLYNIFVVSAECFHSEISISFVTWDYCCLSNCFYYVISMVDFYYMGSISLAMSLLLYVILVTTTLYKILIAAALSGI